MNEKMNMAHAVQLLSWAVCVHVWICRGCRVDNRGIICHCWAVMTLTVCHCSSDRHWLGVTAMLRLHHLFFLHRGGQRALSHCCDSIRSTGSLPLVFTGFIPLDNSQNSFLQLIKKSGKQVISLITSSLKTLVLSLKFCSCFAQSIYVLLWSTKLKWGGSSCFQINNQWPLIYTRS